MDKKWNFTNDRPIYFQIVEQIKDMIISGALAPGDRVYTVREISESASVNPNTVQKAFSEFSTAGRFVTKDTTLITVMKIEKRDEVVGAFLLEMNRLGFSKDQVLKIITEYEEV